MQQYVDTLEYEFDNCGYEQLNESNDHFLINCIQALESVNKQLSGLLRRKDELTENIIDSLGAKRKGQKTYEFHTWKVEVRTSTPRTTVNIKERL